MTIFSCFKAKTEAQPIAPLPHQCSTGQRRCNVEDKRFAETSCLQCKAYSAPDESLVAFGAPGYKSDPVGRQWVNQDLIQLVHLLPTLDGGWWSALSGACVAICEHLSADHACIYVLNPSELWATAAACAGVGQASTVGRAFSCDPRFNGSAVAAILRAEKEGPCGRLVFCSPSLASSSLLDNDSAGTFGATPQPTLRGLVSSLDDLPGDWQVLAEEHGCQAFAAVGLADAEGNPVGVLSLATKAPTRPAAWTPEALHSIVALLSRPMQRGQAVLASPALSQLHAAATLSDLVTAAAEAAVDAAAAVAYVRGSSRVALIHSDVNAAAIFQQPASHPRGGPDGDRPVTLPEQHLLRARRSSCEYVSHPALAARKSVTQGGPFARISVDVVGGLHGGDRAASLATAENALKRESWNPARPTTTLTTTTMSFTFPSRKDSHCKGHTLTLDRTLLGEALGKRVAGLCIDDCQAHTVTTKAYPRDLVLSRGALIPLSLALASVSDPEDEGRPLMALYVTYGTTLPKPMLQAVVGELQQLLQAILPAIRAKLNGVLRDEYAVLGRQLEEASNRRAQARSARTAQGADASSSDRSGPAPAAEAADLFTPRASQHPDSLTPPASQQQNGGSAGGRVLSFILQTAVAGKAAAGGGQGGNNNNNDQNKQGSAAPHAAGAEGVGKEAVGGAAPGNAAPAGAAAGTAAPGTLPARAFSSPPARPHHRHTGAPADILPPADLPSPFFTRDTPHPPPPLSGSLLGGGAPSDKEGSGQGQGPPDGGPGHGVVVSEVEADMAVTLGVRQGPGGGGGGEDCLRAMPPLGRGREEGCGGRECGRAQSACETGGANTQRLLSSLTAVRSVSFRLEKAHAPRGASKLAPIIASMHERLRAAQAVQMTFSRSDARKADLQSVKLLQEIGRGGYGTVYRATYHGAEVAIKVIEQSRLAGGGPGGASNRDAAAANNAAGGGGPGGGGPVGIPSSSMGLGLHKQHLHDAIELVASVSMSHINIVQVPAYFMDVRLEKPEDFNPLDSVDAPTESRPFRLTHSPSLLESPGPDNHAFNEGAMALVLEYCDCGSLCDAIMSRKFIEKVTSKSLGPGKTYLAINMRSVYTTLLEIALALRHMHSLALVHCDLKPQNVLLKSSPRDPRGFTVKLSDFGLAKMMAHDEEGQLVIDEAVASGTITHVAPEVLLGQKALGAAVDIYAFGILMFQVLCGMKVYDRSMTASGIANAVAHRGMRPQLPGWVPSSYRSLAEACWEHLPSDRPTADQLVHALERALEAKKGGGAGGPGGAGGGSSSSKAGGQQQQH